MEDGDLNKLRGCSLFFHRPGLRPPPEKLRSRSVSAVQLLFFASAALRLCVFSCGARRRIRRRSLRSAALALAVVFPLAWAAGLCPRQIHAGISGLRCRGRRSGAFLRLQPCRPVRPVCVSRLPAPSAPGERSALRRPAWSRAADLLCPTSAHRSRLRAPVSPAQNSGASAALRRFRFAPTRS